MAKLVVFVHGLGADDYDWWGSTKHLISDKYKDDQDTDFLFYRYKTDKTSGFFNKLALFFGFGTKLADFDGLGGLLLSEINNYISGNEKYYEEIKFFGHSMGGIVVASCIYKMRLQSDPLYLNVTSIALCGTPLGGSKIAARIDRLIPYKTSSHTKLLRYRNKKLKNIINNFASVVSLYYNEHKPQLIFFKIEDDEVVQTDEEKFGSYDKDDIEALSYSMKEGHVGAVQNLESNHPNFNQIIKWIEEENVYQNIPDDEVDNFKQFISNNTFSHKLGISKGKLKNIYLEYINTPKYNDDGVQKRPYIDLSIHARKTYLKPRDEHAEDKLAITDFKRIVKIVNNNEGCEFEIINGFLKGSKYTEVDYLKELKKTLKDRKRINAVNRFNDVVMNIGYRVDGEQKLFTPPEEDVKILDYENDKYKGLRIVCNLGDFAIGQEIEFLVSITLPVNIWDYPQEKDTFAFPVLTIDRKYIIQEEIYGDNNPKLEPTFTNTGMVHKEKDRSLYYNRYIFTNKNNSNFDTISISYKMKQC